MATLSSIQSDTSIATTPTSVSPYTVVDVKFEADDSSNQELISNFVGHAEENINKRKRTAPTKVSAHDNDVDDDISEEELDMSAVVKVEYASSDNHDESYDDIACDNNTETDENLALVRANNQQVNSKQRDDCPVCGDRANGLHYGIYSCEG